MIERLAGKVELQRLSTANRRNISKAIDAVATPGASMLTEESTPYKNLPKKGFTHEMIIHANKGWVRTNCYSETIDGFWSLL